MIRTNTSGEEGGYVMDSERWMDGCMTVCATVLTLTLIAVFIILIVLCVEVLFNG